MRKNRPSRPDAGPWFVLWLLLLGPRKRHGVERFALAQS